MEKDLIEYIREIRKVAQSRWMASVRKIQREIQRALMWVGLAALVYVVARMAGGG